MRWKRRKIQKHRRRARALAAMGWFEYLQRTTNVRAQRHKWHEMTITYPNGHVEKLKARDFVYQRVEMEETPSKEALAAYGGEVTLTFEGKFRR